MIVVTGGAGFVGSNIIKALNEQGETNILVVDDLSDGKKFVNIADCEFLDYLDKDDFLAKLQRGENFATPITAILHQGACATTTEWDGRFMLQNNYEYSKILLHYCLDNNVRFVYASSAAVYGNGKAGFCETPECEKPLNVYGYSKYLFDKYVRKIFAANSHAATAITGLRYFNVYGPREQHKGSMASVAWHLQQQILQHDTVKLFAGSDGYADGEQRRDFIYVDDVANINLWFLKNNVSGIFNVGTGRSEPFNAVAAAVIAKHQRGKVEYIPFPAHLQNCYQSFTEADIAALRRVGYTAPFKTVSEGVSLYLNKLTTN